MSSGGGGRAEMSKEEKEAACADRAVWLERSKKHVYRGPAVARVEGDRTGFNFYLTF